MQELKLVHGMYTQLQFFHFCQSIIQIDRIKNDKLGIFQMYI